MSETQAASPGARDVAARVLESVYRKRDFAARALDDALSGVAKGPDRALATELVYGVLRTRRSLEAELSALAKRGIAGNDQRVLLHLLIAAYQIRYLERVPAFAAVDEAVRLVNRERGKRVGGFCNALLRNFSQRSGAPLERAIEDNAPTWLLEEMTRSVGRQHALDLLGVPEDGEEQARPRVAQACLRLRDGAPVPAWLEAASPGQVHPRSFKLEAAGNLRQRPEFSAGHYVVQDEGSMFAALLLGARPGERILDACAGRGQKTSLIAEEMQGRGVLWATDKGEKKLAALQEEFRRLSLPPAQTSVLDWTQGAEAVPRDFDRVLVDAPCTGTGTLRRRPEIMLRLSRQDVTRLSELAESILRAATRHAAVGGRVQFVLCSVLHEECEALVEKVADVLEPIPFDVSHPLLAEGAAQLRLLPRTHGTDGFFIASFRRVR